MNEPTKLTLPSIGQNLGQMVRDKANAEHQEFYQSYSWRKFRAKIKARQLKHDFELASKMFSEKKVSFFEYNDWLLSESPLCQASLAKGKLIAAQVLDHIRPIKQGGPKYNTNNLQWLSHDEHNRKRQTER